MQRATDRYFKDCDTGRPREKITKKGKVVIINEPTPYSVQGLAYALGFSSTQSLTDYKAKDAGEEDAEHPSFSGVLARARLRILAHRIEQGLLGYQESKVVALDLAVTFKMRPKLELPEGAKILIGYSKEAPAAAELPDGTPQQQPKVEQITE